MEESADLLLVLWVDSRRPDSISGRFFSCPAAKTCRGKTPREEIARTFARKRGGERQAKAVFAAETANRFRPPPLCPGQG